MRKTYQIIVFLFACTGLFAQHIVEYEHWMDNGYSERQINTNVSSTLQWQTTIDCGNLTAGLHSFNIRFKDSQGLWSSTKTHYFQKLPVSSSNEIVYYEYWINDDYDWRYSGFVAGGGQTVSLLEEIDTSILNGRSNILHFRFKDKFGLWSPVISNPIGMPAKADFSYIMGLSDVAFTNRSKNADSYYWDFGDGTTSTQVNPSHTYEKPGSYQVSLYCGNEFSQDYSSQHVEVVEGIRAGSNKGGNGGVATVIFYGNGLTDNTQVALQNGSGRITGENIKLIAPGKLEVEFDLLDKTIGVYDIEIVDNTTFGEIILAQGYTIEEVVQPEVWAEIIGNNTAIADRWQTYTISYGNKGNVDAISVPVWLAFSDVPGLEIEFVDFEVLPPELDYELDETLKEKLLSTPIFIDVDTFQYQPFDGKVYPLYMPKIPANYTQDIRIRIKAAQSVQFRVWIDEPLANNDFSNLRTKSDVKNNNPLYLKCVVEMMEQVMAQTALGAVPISGCFSDLGYTLKAFHKYMAQKGKIGLASLLWGTSFTLAGCVMDMATVVDAPTIVGPIISTAIGASLNAIGGFGSFALGKRDCARQFPPLGDPSNSELTIQQTNSYDPNEILGTSGYGEQNFIREKDHLGYAIYFENDPELATAPVQEIFLTNTLDLTKFDPEDFSFGTFTFRDTTIHAIPGIHEFTKDVDMRGKGENMIVRISATFDKAEGIINWYLTALDPETMDLTENPYLGILYPNTAPPVGEGNVTYRIGLRQDFSHGAAIKNKAHITFDLNEPIATNEYVNTFDLSLPSSSMNSSYTIEKETVLTVSWTGNDTGSGVAAYTVYMSDNNNGYEICFYQTKETSGQVIVQPDHEYKFFVFATDNVGNMEEKPEQVELTVKVEKKSGNGNGGSTVGIENISETDLFTVAPNPAETEAIVEFYVKESGYVALDLYDISGRRVMAVHNGRLLAGKQSLHINVAGLSKGIYFLHLQKADKRETRKLIIN